MKPKLVVRREAVSELAHAYRWYDEHRPGLGAEFLDSVTQALRAVQSRPRSFPVADGQVRRAILRRFPYAIFFRCEENQILVLAVFHGRRKPQ